MAKKKRNPQDLTLRNLRAGQTRLNVLEGRLDILEGVVYAISSLLIDSGMLKVPKIRKVKK